MVSFNYADKLATVKRLYIQRFKQDRNEVYGIRDQRPKKGWDQGSQPRIRDQSPRDRDQRVFHGLKDQASRFCGIRDQNFHHFWDQGLKICVKIRDQRRKNIPRYDPASRVSYLSERRACSLKITLKVIKKSLSA